MWVNVLNRLLRNRYSDRLISAKGGPVKGKLEVNLIWYFIESDRKFHAGELDNDLGCSSIGTVVLLELTGGVSRRYILGSDGRLGVKRGLLCGQ